ncbi:MAG: hypothetical protein RSE54_06460 [Ruthenibacterium sp.]
MNELTVVVSSCDKYADILPAFLEMFRKYWEKCQYSIVLTTQSEPQNLKKGDFDCVYAWGVNVPWTQRLLFALKELDTPYIMFFLDDFFLNAPFTNEQALHLLDIVKKHAAASLKLIPSPEPPEKITDEYGKFVKGKAYRVTAQVTIWNREYLIRLLENIVPSGPWNFERSGSFVSDQYPELLLGTYCREFPYEEIICGARWIASGRKFCENENVKIDFSVRDNEPRWYLRYRQLRGLIFRINPTFITKIILKFQKDTNGR